MTVIKKEDSAEIDGLGDTPLNPLLAACLLQITF